MKTKFETGKFFLKNNLKIPLKYLEKQVFEKCIFNDIMTNNGNIFKMKFWKQFKIKEIYY